MKKILLLIGIALLIIGCFENQENSPVAREELSIYFYYYPDCPWCRMVKPYIELLDNETDLYFEFCNTKHINNCSDEAVNVSKKIKLRGVPTLVVKNSTSIIHVYVGAYEVAGVGEFLKSRGYDVTTNFTVKGLNYSAKDCIECHAENRLPPPSTYTCSACCHE